MSGTYHILNIGWTAMSTHRLASDVTGHNIANVSTEGYSRQRPDLQANRPWLTRAGPLGTGVEATAIGSLRDTLLERTLIGAAAEYGFSSGRLSVLEPVEVSLGVGDDDPINDALSSFFSALGDLAADPAGAVQRNQVLAAAENLGSTMRQVRAELSQTRSSLDNEIGGLADEIQKRMEEMAVLNREIRLTEASGGQANDLKDRRNLLAREIGERIGVATFQDDEGNLNLMLTAGGVLVEGDRCATLQTVADPGNGGLLAPELVTGSGVRIRLDASISGRLGGLLSARDAEVLTAITDLDDLATSLVAEVNLIHRAGVGLDGVGGRDLFDPGAATAADVRLDAAMVGQPDRLAAALDPAALPGDNQNALALCDLAGAAFMAGGTRTPGDFWRSSVSALGSGLSDAARDYELHAGRLSQIVGMREAVSGVSIDEEMIELTKAQRAFEAAAKVIQTGDELLETILSLK